jgi:methionyl aminopeptidase
MNIAIKTETELSIMRIGGRKLAEIVNQLIPLISVRHSGRDVEKKAQELIFEAGGQPSFSVADRRYPYATCLSINDAIVHGLPQDKVFKKGQVVGLDIGLYYQGFHLDTATTIGIGKTPADVQHLLAATRKSLELAIQEVQPGRHLGIIGNTIQNYIEKQGFSVIRQLTGHGIGRNLHEKPVVANFGQPNDGPIMMPGMVLAIEPMVSAGDWLVYVDQDGWTVRIKDGSYGAHFEHTIAVTVDGCEVLT